MCVRESNNTANCFLAATNQDSCNVCDINYFHNNGNCQKSNAYETSYDSRNVFEKGYDGLKEGAGKVTDKITGVFKFETVLITGVITSLLFA